MPPLPVTHSMFSASGGSWSVHSGATGPRVNVCNPPAAVGSRGTWTRQCRVRFGVGAPLPACGGHLQSVRRP